MNFNWKKVCVFLIYFLFLYYFIIFHIQDYNRLLNSEILLKYLFIIIILYYIKYNNEPND